MSFQVGSSQHYRLKVPDSLSVRNSEGKPIGNTQVYIMIYCIILLRIKLYGSVALACLAESLSSNPAGSEMLISILGLGIKFVLCLLSVLCCLWRLPWHCADHTFREARTCVSVYSVLNHSLLFLLQASDPRAFGM